MRSGTEALLHGMTAWPTSCDSWHGVGCHECVQTFLLSLWLFFQWVYVKDTHLKLFWKIWNYQKCSINPKHLLTGKTFFFFCSTITSFCTGWEQLSVSATLPSVHLAQSIVYSVRGRAVPFFFPPYCRMPWPSLGISHVSVLEGQRLVLWSQC